MTKYVESNLIRDEHIVYETRLHWITFVSLKALLTLFIAPLIARATSEFAITNKRIIIKVELMSRHTLEMNLSKAESGGSRHLGAYPWGMARSPSSAPAERTSHSPTLRIRWSSGSNFNSFKHSGRPCPHAAPAAFSGKSKACQVFPFMREPFAR